MVEGRGLPVPCLGSRRLLLFSFWTVNETYPVLLETKQKGGIMGDRKDWGVQCLADHFAIVPGLF